MTHDVAARAGPSSGNGRLWLYAFIAWTAFALLSAAQFAAVRTFRGQSFDWFQNISIALSDWYTCGIFTPAIYWVVRHYPLRGGKWRVGLPVHVAASLAFVVCKTALYSPIVHWLASDAPPGYGPILLGGFVPDMMGFWGAAGILHAVAYYRESQERMLEAARLDGALRAAELETLRSQLQPHFLFNTLQSISTLLHRDPKAADRMLTDLSDLLRVSLKHTAAQEVPLRDELQFLDKYLDIMRVRFGDRLSIEIQVADELLDAKVPSLVLQPLTENAIRHGMAERTDRGRVAVRAVREGAALRLEVSDDGPGLSVAPVAEGNGIGLANTRERLAKLYGAAGKVEIRDRQGLTVALTFPFRR